MGFYLFIQRIQGVFCCISLLICIGCSSVKTAPMTGFLTQYNVLTKDERYKDLYVYKKPGFDSNSYSNFVIDPVVVFFHPEARGSAINPERLKELTDFFQGEIIEQFEIGFKKSDGPQAKTFRIKVAVTDIIPNKPYLNLHWSTTLAGFGIGGAALEAEIVDSQTGERLLAIVDTRKGKRRKYTKGWTKFGHTKDIFTQWAKLLKDMVDPPESQ